MPANTLRSYARPAEDYEAAVARIETLQARDTFEINPLSHTHFLTHGQKTDRVVVWFHGYTNSPAEFAVLGQRCFGVAGAAEAYFGKEVRALAVEEVAYLAILPKGPAVFHPERAGIRALERRNWLLGEMADAGLIAGQVAKGAMDSPLGVRGPLGTCDRE